MVDRVGQRLDSYQLVRLLGAGGFGEVYLAEHIYRKVQVAIKVLPPLAENDLPDFLNEARTFRLRHPHIVQIVDFGVENRVPFIVMEYAPRGTLRQRHPRGSRLPLVTILSYTRQVADALHYAHIEKLIHRDVKPENMLLGPNDEVLLSDFGIATIAHSSHSQSILEIAGTVTYMAPEQIQGRPVIASDQYALGVVVYEWLCGERPFKGSPMEIATQHMLAPVPPLHEKIPEIPSAIEQVVITALMKDPNKRFASVLLFANALEQACGMDSHSTVIPASVLPSSAAHVTIDRFIASTPALQEQATNDQPASAPFPPIVSAPTSSPGTFTAQPVTAHLSLPVSNFKQATSINSLTNAPVSSLISRTSEVRAASVREPRRKRKSLPYPILVGLLLSLLVIIAGSTYFILRPNSAGGVSNIDQSLQQAQSLIAQSNSEVSTNPVQALDRLRQAQSILRGLQKEHLSSDQTQKVDSLLNGNFTTAVRKAIRSYNQLSSITTLPCTTMGSTAINTGTSGTLAKSAASVLDTTGAFAPFYALGEDHQLYHMQNEGSEVYIFSSPSIALPNNATALALAGNGSQLLLLMKQDTIPFTTYTIGASTVSGVGLGIGTGQFNWKTAIISQGMPGLITAWGQDIYVASTYSSIPNAVHIEHFTANVQSSPTQFTFSVAASIVSMTAFPNHQIFLLLADGSVESMQLTDGKQNPPTPVLIQHPITQTLPVNSQDFTFTQNVPAVTPVTSGNEAPLTVSGNAMLTAGMVNGIPHLFILDTTNHRVLDLKETGSNTGPEVGFQLVQQYASSSILAQAKSITFDPQNPQIDILSQDDQSYYNLVTIGVSSQTACIS